jgi:hypothetical protein
VRQVGVAEWPKGLEFPLAMIPDDVVPSLGLHFEAYEEEGLGLHFAAIVSGEAGVFALLRGVGYPGTGTQVWCMGDGANAADRIAAFCSAFRLGDADIIWRTPSVTARIGIDAG